MIEMFTARITEIDDIDIAFNELTEQIDLTKLKKNSGGIIFCHSDFIDSGVAKTISDRLGFNVIGMTSFANSDKHGFSLYELNITILTSDEVTFEAGMIPINRDNYMTATQQLFDEVRAKVDSDPALIFTFMPYIREVSGYEIVEAMDKACHGIPLWGAITNNIDFNYEAVETFCNGENNPAGVAMLFMNGPVEPTFIIESIPERNIANSRAIITKSEGAVIYEVNDMPILEYLKGIGIILAKENITTTPLMIYYDGAVEPVALGFYSLFEDGSVLTGGRMPVGTSFSVGCIDEAGIRETIDAGLQSIIRKEDREATLLLPCITRYIMLAPDQEAELRIITETLTSIGKPFMMGYSGGEICPMKDNDGNLCNRFHNYTFCAVTF